VKAWRERPDRARAIVRALVNPAVRQAEVPEASPAAGAFHAGLPGYRPTPVRELPGVAEELGLAAVSVKDESDRLGLPAFKVLGASWAAELAMREHPDAQILVAASAGNHGRAVARVARERGLACRIFLPAGSVDARREAIAKEGAEAVVVDGGYEAAVTRAGEEGQREGAVEIADVGESGSATWVIDGYATLFAEADSQADFDLILVPVGVGSLAAAAARFAAAHEVRVVGVEPVTAACLSASLAAGRPTALATPGTKMAGMNCAEISPAAWPSLHRGVHGTIAIGDDEAERAMTELARDGLTFGQCGAAPLAGLRALVSDARCADLRKEVELGFHTRLLLIATEGITDGGLA